jgi:hypothetical protein
MCLRVWWRLFVVVESPLAASGGWQKAKLPVLAKRLKTSGRRSSLTVANDGERASSLVGLLRDCLAGMRVDDDRPPDGDLPSSKAKSKSALLLLAAGFVGGV